MSQYNQNFYANGMMNGQQINQISQALYSYCKVMRVPKMGVAPAVITVLEGVAMTLLLVAFGVKFLVAVVVGVIVFSLFAFLCWLAYKYRVGASKRLNFYLAADGGQRMFIDFASAQPFARDQFRVGRYFLFIKNGAVIRRDGIIDIVRIANHYRAMPTGVSLSIKVKDENGSMTLPLCRLHVLNAGAQINEIRYALMQRPW
ncbi:MAG: hypothetical protein K6C35_03430 [Eubacterium sp.]|nr:hypothetical protein [Eubacterium sp.]